jgi:hypothetical protein
MALSAFHGSCAEVGEGEGGGGAASAEGRGDGCTAAQCTAAQQGRAAHTPGTRSLAPPQRTALSEGPGGRTKRDVEAAALAVRGRA